MSARLRFLFDEQVPVAIVQGLRRRGIDVATAVEMGLRGADDEVLLEAARRTDRVVVTQDEDFLRHHADGIPHAGVAYYKQGSRTVSQVLQALTQLHDVLTPNDAFGQILYL